LPRRKVVVIDDFVYKSFEELADRYGIGVNELMNHYLNLFTYLRLTLEDDVASLSEVLRSVPGKDLLRFSLSRILLATGGLYSTLRTLVKSFGFLEKGFCVELVNPVVDRYGDPTGVEIEFVASTFSKTPIESANLQIIKTSQGVEGVLKACTIIGFKEDLGSEYEILRSKLKNVLEEDDVQDALEDLESSICGQCDLCEVDAKVEDMEDSLELHVEAYADDYTCLPRIEEFEEVVNTILRKTGIEKLKQTLKVNLEETTAFVEGRPYEFCLDV